MDLIFPKLNPVIGHATVQRVLSVQKLAPVSALLFCGPAGVGKKFSAVHFAWGMLSAQADLDYQPSWQRLWEKSDPNFLWLGKPEEATRIGIPQIHELQQQIALGPRLGSRYLFVLVDEAGFLTSEAANALLKTLEEPPPGVIFLVISSQPLKLLSTIRSRCLPLWFGFLKPEELEHIIAQNNWPLAPPFTGLIKNSGHLSWLTPEQDWQKDLVLFFENCENLDQLSAHDALDLAEELSHSKAKAQYFLEALLYWLRQKQHQRGIGFVLDTLKQFPYNINLKLQLEKLMLQFCL